MDKRLTADELAGAIARGWCHPTTEHLTMDPALALAIAVEVEKLLVEKGVFVAAD